MQVLKQTNKRKVSCNDLLGGGYSNVKMVMCIYIYIYRGLELRYLGWPTCLFTTVLFTKDFPSVPLLMFPISEKLLLPTRYIHIYVCFIIYIYIFSSFKFKLLLIVLSFYKHINLTIH